MSNNLNELREQLRKKEENRVIKSGEYKGFQIQMRNPHLYYFIVGREEGKEIPTELLNSTFTDKDAILLAIDRSIQKEEQANVTP